MKTKPQRGVISILAALFLIVAVLFILSRSLQISGTTAMDGSLQSDSVNALFIAESGLERAAGTLKLNNSCASINGGSFNFGPGSFQLSSSSPGLSCDSGNGNVCTVISSGISGTRVRNISRDFCVSIVTGIYKVDCQMQMTLTNPYSVGTVALFHLGFATDSSGNVSGAPGTCPNNGGNAALTGCTNCSLNWNVLSTNSGDPVIGSLATTSNLNPGASFTVTQTLNKPLYLAEVGGFFPGFNATPPAIVGSYWDDNGGTQSVNSSAGSSPSFGYTNNGSATASGACTLPNGTHPGSGSSQACTDWCYGGDTLVLGIAPLATAYPNISDVKFNTTGGTPQNIDMIVAPNGLLVNYPKQANKNSYSMIWFAYNPDYLYGAVVTASIAINQAGTTFNASTTLASNTLTVNTITNGALSVGETVTGSGIPAGTKISAFLTGKGGAGTYTLSANATATGTAGMTATTSILTVSNVATGAMQVGQTLSGTGVVSGTTVFMLGPVVGGNQTYYLSVPTTTTVLTSRTINSGATSVGNTLNVPNGNLPTVGTLLALRAGNGALQASTKVVTVDAVNKQFTVSPAPSTVLNGAQVCGGTCAFFDQTPGNTTRFSVTNTGTTQWASGFTCLKGVDASLINAIPVSTSTQGLTWHEIQK